MTTRFNIAAGNRNSFMGFLNDVGRFIGGTPTAPAAGSASGAYELLGIKSVPLNTPESEVVSITGEDGWLGDFEFDSTASRRYIVTLAVHDPQLDAYLLNINLEELGGILMGANDIEGAPERNVCLVHQGRSKKFNASDKGNPGYEGVFIPRATAKPLWREAFEERAAALYRISITPAMASYMPWGVTINGQTVGTTGLVKRPFQSTYPVHIVAFTGNGITSTFTLPYEPVSAARTKAFRGQGIPLTVNSVSTSPRQVTLSAAPADGENGYIVYEFARK